jgi:hypothetical protein
MDLWRSLQTPGVRHGEDPLHTQPAYVRSIDLFDCRVSISADVAVHAGPIRLRCYTAVSLPGFAQQMNVLIVRAQLQFPSGATERDAFQF